VIVASWRGRVATKLLTYVVLIGFAVFCLLPVIWMLDTALKPTDEIRSVNPHLLIAHPSLVHFREVLLNTHFALYFRNSVIVASGTTLIALVVATLSGYALSRFPGLLVVRGVGNMLVISQMMPGVLLLVPLYILIRRLGLLDTFPALLLAYTTFMVPLCALMLRGFFDAIPRELEEAAELDGCSRLAILLRIILPLSLPGLLATGLFAFVNAWNEFMFAYVLTNSDEHRTLTPGIMLFKGLYTTDWGGLMAASVLAVLPVAIVFTWLQRFLVQGLTTGAVKG
jgi:multiple sugar transport system permease protein